MIVFLSCVLAACERTGGNNDGVADMVETVYKTIILC